ncbi:hypothetical protein DFP78_11364 [Photobacterium lutimaris]|nr:hypothetical protein DFP78_11364 [Photobacterium lutimaris]
MVKSLRMLSKQISVPLILFVAIGLPLLVMARVIGDTGSFAKLGMSSLEVHPPIEMIAMPIVIFFTLIPDAVER